MVGMRDCDRWAPGQLKCEIERYEYILAAYLRHVEATAEGAINVFMALVSRYPGEFCYWYKEHLADVPFYVHTQLQVAGLESPDGTPLWMDFWIADV